MDHGTVRALLSGRGRAIFHNLSDKKMRRVNTRRIDGLWPKKNGKSLVVFVVDFFFHFFNGVFNVFANFFRVVGRFFCGVFYSVADVFSGI